MKLFTSTLDAILGAETLPMKAGVFENTSILGQVDAAAPTRTYNGPIPGDNRMGTAAQWQEVEQMRKRAKAESLAALSVDQKIDLALKQSGNAEQIAYQTAGSVSSLEYKLDRAFDNLNDMIARLGQGKPKEAEPPAGSSIFDGDDEDQQSILYRS